MGATRIVISMPDTIPDRAQRIGDIVTAALRARADVQVVAGSTGGHRCVLSPVDELPDGREVMECIEPGHPGGDAG